MIKSLLAIPGIMLLSAATAFAQTPPLSTVFDIQNVPASRLANCDDAPDNVGDTVRVQGIVIAPGNARPSSGQTRQVWIRDISSGGGFHSITVFANAATSPDDLQSTVAGDTIEVVGTILEFNGSGNPPNNDGETEIVPFLDQVTIIGSYRPGNPVPTATLLPNIGILNDINRLNNLETGEQWEGGFVEIQNATVTAVSFFSNNTRVSFTVADAQGNKVEISDRFSAGRLDQGFIAPNVGDVFTSIRGIVIHNKNRCTGTGANNRGYTINPFNSAHYVRGAQAPTITAITRALVSPCTTDVVNISATITDDGTVTGAKLFYAIGATTGAYTSVDMTAGASNLFTAAIPAQAEGTIVKYYIRANDNSGNTTNVPNVPGTNPLFYVVRCGAPLIRDLQYTPFTDGASGYRNLTVSNVEGIVTADASSGNLGQVYMQMPGESAWAGIWLVGSAVANLTVGDLVRVSGTVEEDFNVTRINVSSANRVSGGNTLTPITLGPNVLTTYGFDQNEQYEGMLVRVANPTTGEPLYVVDTNTANGNSNFGEWRLGADRFDPNQGVVIHTGNRSNTNYSSLSVSYINSIPRWGAALNPGVTPVQIGQGDQFSSATGIVYYGFGLLKLLPRTNDDLPGYISPVKRSLNNGSQFVSILPNPAHGRATVSIASAGLGRDLNGAGFSVTTVLGNVVKVSGTLKGQNTSIDLSTLAPGLYNLVIAGPAGTITKKLVVE